MATTCRCISSTDTSAAHKDAEMIITIWKQLTKINNNKLEQW